MPARIRLAGHDDLQVIAEVRADAWAETYTGLLPEALVSAQLRRVPTVVRHLQGVLDEGGSLWLAQLDGAVVGHAYARASYQPDAPRALELSSLYLLRRAQGIGLGRRLLWTAIGDSPCQLWVLQSNERAIAFYRAAGFEHDGAQRELAPSFEGAQEIRMVRG